MYVIQLDVVQFLRIKVKDDEQRVNKHSYGWVYKPISCLFFSSFASNMTQGDCAQRSYKLFLQCSTINVAMQHKIVNLVFSGVDLILPDATPKLIPSSACQARVFSYGSTKYFSDAIFSGKHNLRFNMTPTQF